MELMYDLYALPTSQHRAGLAGLVLLLRIMQRLRLPNMPDIGVAGPRVRLVLEETHLVTLFNFLYDASTEERRDKRPRKRNGVVVEPLRIDLESIGDERGDSQEKVWYVYPQVAPRAAFLRDLGMSDIWLKLWRDVVWTTLRGIPKTRLPFEQRAGGRDAAEGHALWKDLQKWEKTRNTARPLLVSLAGSIYVGAMATNSEDVPFRDTPDRVLLLHCWQAVMGVGEVRRLVVRKGEFKEESAGYVITVPDVLDLDGFCSEFEASVAQLRPEPAGYRPRDGVFALPFEGGLQYLLSLASAKASPGHVRFTLAGVDVFCLRKQGNTIPILAAGRVPAELGLVEQYGLIRGQYGNLLFREQLLRNLLRERPWYESFERLFSLHDTERFIGSNARDFPVSAARRLRADAASEGGTDD